MWVSPPLPTQRKPWRNRICLNKRSARDAPWGSAHRRARVTIRQAKNVGHWAISESGSIRIARVVCARSVTNRSVSVGGFVSDLSKRDCSSTCTTRSYRSLAKLCSISDRSVRAKLRFSQPRRLPANVSFAIFDVRRPSETRIAATARNMRTYVPLISASRQCYMPFTLPR
jgi:hypothetical protein